VLLRSARRFSESGGAERCPGRPSLTPNSFCGTSLASFAQPRPPVARDVGNAGHGHHVVSCLAKQRALGWGVPRWQSRVAFCVVADHWSAAPDDGTDHLDAVKAVSTPHEKLGASAHHDDVLGHLSHGKESRKVGIRLSGGSRHAKARLWVHESITQLEQIDDDGILLTVCEEQRRAVCLGRTLKLATPRQSPVWRCTLLHKSSKLGVSSKMTLPPRRTMAAPGWSRPSNRYARS
jgi:hypothetical protein